MFEESIHSDPIYFPMHIYQYEPTTPLKNRKRYSRFECHFSKSLPHFMDQYTDKIKGSEIRDWKKKWKWIQTVWCIHPRYESVFKKGYSFLLFENNEEPPFETFRILTTDSPEYPYSFSTSKFGVALYQLPNTVLGCLILNVFPYGSTMLEDIVFVMDKFENDPLNNSYNFLPFQKNRNVPFYEVNYSKPLLFLFFYINQPTDTRWTSTASNICYPLSSGSYSSYEECSRHQVSRHPFTHAYFQDPMKQIISIGQSLPPNSTSVSQRIQYVLFILLVLFVCILLCLRYWT